MCFTNEQRCFVVFRLKIHFFSGRFIKKEAKPSAGINEFSGNVDQKIKLWL